jgi:hypothetical protein
MEIKHFLENNGFINRIQKTENLIGLLKEKYDIDLPKDYLFYLSNFENFEGYLNEEYLCFWPIDEIIEINEMNCIFDLDPKTIGIGTNGGGELIALQQTGTGWNVVMMHLIGLDDPIEIGTSFSNFLERMI